MQPQLQLLLHAGLSQTYATFLFVRNEMMQVHIRMIQFQLDVRCVDAGISRSFGALTDLPAVWCLPSVLLVR